MSRVSLITAAVVGLGASACRTPTPSPSLPPIGSGPLTQVSRPGLVAAPFVSSLFAGEPGTTPFVVVAWKARTAAGTDDVFVSTSRDNAASFSEPLRVNAPGAPTVIEGDGGPLVSLTAPGAAGSVALPDIRVEWTARTGRATQRVAARSTDGGRTFRTESAALEPLVDLAPAGDAGLSSPSIADAVDAGSPRHVTFAIDESDTIAVVWDEATGGGRVMLRRLLPRRDGTPQALPVAVISDEAPAASPAIAAIRGGVLVAWTRGAPGPSTIAVRRVGLDTWCATPPSASREVSGMEGHR